MRGNWFSKWNFVEFKFAWEWQALEWPGNGSCVRSTSDRNLHFRCWHSMMVVNRFLKSAGSVARLIERIGRPGGTNACELSSCFVNHKTEQKSRKTLREPNTPTRPAPRIHIHGSHRLPKRSFVSFRCETRLLAAMHMLYVSFFSHLSSFDGNNCLLSSPSSTLPNAM